MKPESVIYKGNKPATAGRSVPAIALSALLVALAVGCSKPEPPVIDDFSAKPSAIDEGAATTLSWKASNADSFVIEPGIGAASGGSVSVSPLETTTYSLTATKGGMSSVKEMTVTVIRKPRGDWFGQKTPGETPVKFSPAGFSGLGQWIGGVAFSPDQTECFVALDSRDYSKSSIKYARRNGDEWGAFEDLDFLKPFEVAGRNMSR